MTAFTLDKKQLKDLEKFYKQAPKQFAAATGMLLNNFAFGTRAQAPRSMAKGMIIRDERFVKSKIRVKKSRFRPPIESQVSTVGSIAGPRFTGWLEQETGAQPNRTRVFHLSARAGSKKRRAPPRFRLRPGNNPPTPDGFPGKSPHHRAIVMLQHLGRQGFKRPFVIKGHKRAKAGLYKFGRGRKGHKRLVMLQRFEKRPAPKRFQWMRRSRKDYMGSINLVAEWRNVLQRSLKPPRSLK